MEDNKQELVSQTTDNMTAGEMLRNARTTGRRKREISTISKLLCIREEFLSALEEGNYRVIPEDVYILGFARSYAVELGLNPDDVILKLKRELGIIKEDKESKEKDEKEEKIVENKPSEKINVEKIKQMFNISKDYVKKHWIWFASSLGALLLVLILILVFVGGGKQSEIVEPQPEPTVVAENTVQGPDFRYPVRESFETKNRKESRVVLQAEKESWVKIEDARGNTVFSRVLVPGDVYYMPLSDKLKGTFGNVGAIDVWVDGQLVKKLGPENTRKTDISMAPNALKAVGFAE